MRRPLAVLLLFTLLVGTIPAPAIAVGLCSVYRTWSTGDSLTAADLNTSFTTVGVTNQVPTCIDDHSPDVTTMRATTDPYPSGTESLATTLAGELERIRYVIKQLTGWSQWYAHTEALASISRGHLFGLTLANNASDATNDIDLATGQAVDSSGTQMLTLAAALTKQLDATWAVGSGAGWRDTGTITNATYHAYLIKRTDTGVVDALASLNNDNTGTITVTIASPAVVTWSDHGLQIGSSLVFSTTGALPTGITAGTRYWVISAGFGTGSFQISTSEGGAAVDTSGSQSGVHTGTASPVMPADYTLRRRIGAILRESSAIVAFTQLGDEFLRNVPIADYSTVSTSATLETLFVPVGVPVHAIHSLTVIATNTATPSYALVTSPYQADTAPSSTVHTVGTGEDGDTPNLDVHRNSVLLHTRTNRAAQIRTRFTSTGSITAAGVTHGWLDTRGRNQ